MVYIDLVMDIVLPFVILALLKGSNIPPAALLFIGFSPVLLYFLYKKFKKQKVSSLSYFVLVSGAVGILIALIRLPKEYFVLREVGITVLIAIALLVSLYTKYSFMKGFLKVMKISKVKLQELYSLKGFDRKLETDLKLSGIGIVLMLFFIVAVKLVLIAHIIIADIQSEEYLRQVVVYEQISNLTAMALSLVLGMGVLISLLLTFKKRTGYTINDLIEKAKEE